MRTGPEDDALETLPPTGAPGHTMLVAYRAAPQHQIDRFSPPPPPPTARLSATFSRIVELHPSRLVGLGGWWSCRAHRGRVRAARGLWLEAPRVQNGTVRMRGRLRSRWFGPPIAVELCLWPWLGEWTKATLEPRRHVVMTRNYFRRGHRRLNALADRLAAELPSR